MSITPHFLVSIMIPTYHAAAFIEELLDSILAQENISLEEIQVVVTDDASTDNTVDIVKKYNKKIKNLVINQNAVNLGITKNCNIGYSYCRGKYLISVAGDDVLFPNRISSQLRWFEQNPEGVLCSSGVEVFEHASKKIIGRYIDKDFLYQRSRSRIIAQQNQLASSRFMFAFEKLPHLRFNEKLPVVSDWLLINECLFYGTYGDTGEMGLRYRRHENNTTKKGIEHYYLEDRLIGIDILFAQHPEMYAACKKQRAYTFHNYAKRCYSSKEMRKSKQFSMYALRENPFLIKSAMLLVLSYLGSVGHKAIQFLLQLKNNIKQRGLNSI